MEPPLKCIWISVDPNFSRECAKCELDSFGSVFACKEFRTCNCLSRHVMSRMYEGAHWGRMISKKVLVM